MDYIIKRSDRKTCAIYIIDGIAEVRAPLRMNRTDIDFFVLSKKEWIRKKLAASLIRAESKAAFSLDYGDKVLYRGKEVLIAAKAGNRIGLSADGFFIPPGLSPEQIKKAVAEIYRLSAKIVLTEKARLFSGMIGTSPEAVKINGAATRWGSCSVKKRLNFSWRIMAADDTVIDYLVVHELAHLIEMNHSERFWAIVNGILPDYKEREKKLRILQNKFGSENWK